MNGPKKKMTMEIRKCIETNENTADQNLRDIQWEIWSCQCLHLK